MTPETKYMTDPYNEFPLLSILFGAISWYTWYLSTFDMQGFDNSILLPLAHLITILSGTVAVCLGVVSIKEKIFKRKRK